MRFSRTAHAFGQRAFTLVELLVVIAILVLLVAILVPALFAAGTAGARAESISNVRQISEWMQLYSQENKQFVLPSRFDYSSSPYPPKVRSNASNQEGYDQYEGTWTDILWTQYMGGVSFPSVETSLGHDYSTDSPDNALYRALGGVENPLRSARENSKGDARDVPGYFAANDFFNADPDDPDRNGWFTIGQIAVPDKSVYLIDSWAGERIADDPPAWDFDGGTSQVDFRYEGTAILLLLDGSIQEQSFFDTLDELETVRKVKVRDLTRR